MDHPSVFPSKKIITLSTLLATLATSHVGAINIELDYSYDAAADNFFATHPQAKAALDQAAADIGALIPTGLAPVTSSYTGSSSDGSRSATATFSWEYLYENPSTGVQTTTTASLAADTIKIFAGVQAFSGFTLAEGAPAGARIGLSGGGFGSQWQGAMDAAVANSNAGMGRGGGPLIRTISGSAALGGVSASYNLEVGAGMGTVTFDVDTDDDGFKNTGTDLEDYWHFDHTTPVGNDKYDFYSVALHEMLHALGIGVSDSWDNQIINSTTWTGSEAISVHGTGNNLIFPFSGHINTNIMSPRLSDNVSQIAAMTPDIGKNERRELTALDAAFLVDLGYTTVPEPSSAFLLGAASFTLLLRRTRP